MGIAFFTPPTLLDGAGFLACCEALDAVLRGVLLAALVGAFDGALEGLEAAVEATEGGLVGSFGADCCD